jgi:hypothetical protein
MARACSICIHPQKKAIESAHQQQVTNRRIAAQYDLSEAAVRRHFASHVQETTPKTKTTRPRLPLPVTRALEKRPQGQNIPPDIKVDVQEAFLEAFIQHGILTRACKEAGISRSTVRQWEEHDASFSPRYAEAKEAVNDVYRDEARRRAVDGTESYVVSQGKIVYSPDGRPLTERKYSDTMLQFVMKARMPEYREKVQQTLEISGKDGGPIRMALSNLSDGELDVLERIAEKATRE